MPLASQSFLVCPSGPVVPGRSSDPLCHLFPLFSSPLVDPFEFGLRPVSPPHSPSCIFFPRLSFSFCPSHLYPSLSSHGYFPLFPLSFHPLKHCLFLATNLTRFVFSQTFRAPPASRPRTATNGTVDASCSATNVCRPPPATAATTKRVCKRCKPPKDNPVAGSGSSSPPTPSVTAPRSASPGKRSGDDCKDNHARATPRRK